VTQWFFGYDATMSAQQPADTADESPQPNSDDSNEPTGSDVEESVPGDIGDDKLPEDLQPTADNPLARHPGQTGDEDDKIGADTEGGDADNPSANITYGSGPDDGGNSGDAPGESDNAEVKAEEDDGSATLDNGGGGAG
jgi:hypothetical protein